MATAADLVTGVLVTELAADDDLIMNEFTNIKHCLITNLILKKRQNRKKLIYHLSHLAGRKKRLAATRRRGYNASSDHDYINGSVPRFGTDEFQEFQNHFKIERSTFDRIVRFVGPQFGNQEKSTLPLERKVLVAMWLLSSQESFRTIGEKFGLQKSTTYYAFTQFLTAVNNNSKCYLFWPDCESLEVIGREFARLYDFVGACGIIDTCQIPVKITSGEDSNDCRAEPYSTVSLQAVCDHRMRFVDIHIGSPQPAHIVLCTWKFFECSPIGKSLSRKDYEMPQGHFLLGNAMYPLRTYLLTPYKDDATQSPEKKKYNEKHNAIQKVIHRAFELLRSKFPRLKYIDTSRHDLVPQIITTACVLHNIILEEEGEINLGESSEGQVYDDEHVHPCPEADHHINDDATFMRDAVAKRFL